MRDTYRGIIKDIIDSQMAINDKTNGPEWLLGFTDKQKPIFWLACIKNELAEAMDCFDWKHWKQSKKEFNFDKFIMEIMDVIHFGVSQVQFVMYWTIITAAKEYHSMEKTPDNIHEFSQQYGFFSVYSELFEKFEQLTNEEVKKLTNDVIMFYYDSMSVESIGETISSNKEKLKKSYTYNGVVNIDAVIVEQITHMLVYYSEEQEFVVRLLTLLATIKEFYNFTEKDIHTAYMVKNALNFLRQDYGYNNPDLVYIRTWNGVDDSEAAMTLYKDNPTADFKEFYLLLEKYYVDRVVSPFAESTALIGGDIYEN